MVFCNIKVFDVFITQSIGEVLPPGLFVRGNVVQSSLGTENCVCDCVQGIGKRISQMNPPLMDELRCLNDARCAIICVFLSCSPSGSGFGYGLGCGLGCGLWEGGFSTFCCSFVLSVLRFKHKIAS